MIDLRALTIKDGHYGVVGLTGEDGKFFLTSYDTRMLRPASIQTAADVMTARNAFDTAVALSRDRGWSVIYYGRPNHG